MNNEIQILFGTRPPEWFNEMLSHPILFVLCFVTIGLGYIQLKQKLNNGQLRIDNRTASIIVFISVFLMMFVATR